MLVLLHFFWVPLCKPNSRNIGTLIIGGLLGNPGLGCLFQFNIPDSLGQGALSVLADSFLSLFRNLTPYPKP